MRNITAALCAGLMFASMLAGCTTHKDVYSSTLAEAHKDAAYEYGPGYARYTDPDLALELSYLNPDGADLYFSKYKGGIYQNPVPPRSYMIFSLNIMNKSTRYVEFNPRMMALVTEDSEPASPKDYSGLYTDMSLAGDENIEERMRVFRAAFFDTSEKIPPGETVHKLLVYQRTEGVKGGGVFIINGIYVGHTSKKIALKYDEELGLPEEE